MFMNRYFGAGRKTIFHPSPFYRFVFLRFQLPCQALPVNFIVVKAIHDPLLINTY